MSFFFLLLEEEERREVATVRTWAMSAARAPGPTESGDAEGRSGIVIW